MANELSQARRHLGMTVNQLYEAVIERNYDKAREYAETALTLIQHIKRIEERQ
jgi:hypothetical protein